MVHRDGDRNSFDSAQPARAAHRSSKGRPGSDPQGYWPRCVVVGLRRKIRPESQPRTGGVVYAPRCNLLPEASRDGSQPTWPGRAEALGRRTNMRGQYPARRRNRPGEFGALKLRNEAGENRRATVASAWWLVTAEP